MLGRGWLLLEQRPPHENLGKGAPSLLAQRAAYQPHSCLWPLLTDCGRRPALPSHTGRHPFGESLWDTLGLRKCFRNSETCRRIGLWCGIASVGLRPPGSLEGQDSVCGGFGVWAEGRPMQGTFRLTWPWAHDSIQWEKFEQVCFLPPVCP